MRLQDLIETPSAVAFKLEDGTDGFVRLLTCDQILRYHGLIKARALASVTGQMTDEGRDFILWLIRWGICHADGKPLIRNDEDMEMLRNSQQSPAGFERLDLLALEVMKHNELGTFAKKKA